MLERRGKGTIEISQLEPVPFELTLSDAEEIQNSKYCTKLSVTKDKVEIYKIKDGHEILLEESEDASHLLHYHASDKITTSWNEAHKYWFSIDSNNLFVKYGQGE
ncbi:unnamed protein product, partial [Didymodactylos carnosus]